MSRVSILDYCDDIKKHSVGMSPIIVNMNKAKCAELRVAKLERFKAIDKDIHTIEHFEDDSIILDSVPSCVKSGKCINVADFDYAQLAEKSGRLGSNLLNGLGGLAGEVVQGAVPWFLSSEGSNEFLVMYMIEELGEKMVFGLLKNIYQKGLIKGVTAACVRGYASFTSSNIVVMAKFMTRMAVSVTTKFATSAAVATAGGAAATAGGAAATAGGAAATTGGAAAKGAALSAVCPPCAVLLAVIVAFQIASVIFDMIDPFGCKDGAQTVEIMNAEYLRNLNESINTLFRDAFLSSIMQNVKLPNGDVVAIENKWPVEYNILGLGGTDEIRPHDDTITKLGLDLQDDCGERIEYTWLTLEILLTSKYISSLTRNSYGQPIYIANNSENDRFIALSDIDISELRGMYALMLSNQNTDLAKWVYAWWPLLLLLFFILIFVLIKLII
jgi:hypothetical protein